MTQNTNNLAAYIWTLADLLRGDFKQSQYGRIILPFTLLRRLECVLEASKEDVLKQVPVVEKMNLPEEAQEKLLLRATGGLSFFNTSPMNLSTLGETGIKANVLYAGVKGQNIAHAHGLLEDELFDSHRGNTALGIAARQDRARQIDLGHDPAAKNIAIGIDIGGHGHDFENQFLILG